MDIIRELELKRVKRSKGAKKDEDGGKIDKGRKVIFSLGRGRREGAMLLFRDTRKRRVIMSYMLKDWMSLISPGIKYGNIMCEKKKYKIRSIS